MLRKMSIREFRRWRAFYDLEPFGEERSDYRAASIVATLVNLHRKRGTREKPIKDFLLQFTDATEKSKPKPWERLKQIGREIAGAAGAFTRKG
jgi:hypothetical protein